MIMFEFSFQHIILIFAKNNEQIRIEKVNQCDNIPVGIKQLW